MFDRMRLRDVLAAYKRDFAPKWWNDEKYKWEAIQCFQENWDVNAPDFADMLKRSLAKTGNLLASVKNYPRKRICKPPKIPINQGHLGGFTVDL